MKISQVPRETAQSVEQSRAAQDKGRVNHRPENTSGPSRAAQADSMVEISENARLMGKAMDVAQGSASDPERVAALKRAILDGSYQVSSGDIADRLLDQHLSIHFGKNSL